MERVNLPGDVNVLGVARPPARDDRYVVKTVRSPARLTSADLYLHAASLGRLGWPLRDLGSGQTDRYPPARLRLGAWQATLSATRLRGRRLASGALAREQEHFSAGTSRRRGEHRRRLRRSAHRQLSPPGHGHNRWEGPVVSHRGRREGPAAAHASVAPGAVSHPTARAVHCATRLLRARPASAASSASWAHQASAQLAGALTLALGQRPEQLAEPEGLQVGHCPSWGHFPPLPLHPSCEQLRGVGRGQLHQGHFSSG